METTKTPIGIKIITILLILIYPIIYFISVNKIEEYYLFRLDIPAILISLVTYFCFLVLFVYLGLKLWKGKNYFRIIVIILSILAPFLKIILDKLFIPQVFGPHIKSPPGGDPSLLFKGIFIYILIATPFYLIAAYLLLSKKAKLFFNR